MKLLAALSVGLLFFVLSFAVAARSQDQQPEPPKGEPAKEAHPGEVAPAPRAVPGSEARPQQEERPAHPEARPQEEPRPAHSEAHQPQAPEHPERTPSHEAAHPPEPNRQAAPEEHPAPKPPTPEEHAHPASQPPIAQPATRAQQPPHPEPRVTAPTPAQQAEWEQHRAANWQSEHRTWQERGGYHGYRVPEERYRAYYGRTHEFRIYEYPVEFVGGYPRFQYAGCWVQMLDPWPASWAPTWFDTDPVYIEYWSDGYYLFDPRYPGMPVAVEMLPC